MHIHERCNDKLGNSWLIQLHHMEMLYGWPSTQNSADIAQMPTAQFQMECSAELQMHHTAFEYAIGTLKHSNYGYGWRKHLDLTSALVMPIRAAADKNNHPVMVEQKQ